MTERDGHAVVIPGEAPETDDEEEVDGNDIYKKFQGNLIAIARLNFSYPLSSSKPLKTAARSNGNFNEGKISCLRQVKL